MSNNVASKCCTEKDVTFDPVRSLVWIDGMPVCQLTITSECVKIRFMDGNKPRADYRGASYLELSLQQFIERLQEIASDLG